MNQFVGIGRLTRDPDSKPINDKAMSKFTIAIDGYKDNTDFVPVIVWGKTAENVEKYCFKGQMVAVAGRVQVRNYTDKDENKRTATEIVAQEVKFLEWKEDDKPKRKAHTSDEDVPF